MLQPIQFNLTKLIKFDEAKSIVDIWAISSGRNQQILQCQSFLGHFDNVVLAPKLKVTLFREVDRYIQ